MIYNETWNFLDESMGIIANMADILSYLPDEESGSDVWTDGEVVYAKTEEELCAVIDWLEDIVEAYGMDEGHPIRIVPMDHDQSDRYWSVCIRKEL